MKNNLPKLSVRSIVGVEAWYRDLQKQGRVFHPDDDPATVINSVTREPIFSAQEAEALRSMIADIREILAQERQDEDAIYEIAMRYSGVPFIAPTFEGYTKPQDGQPAKGLFGRKTFDEHLNEFLSERRSKEDLVTFLQFNDRNGEYDGLLGLPYRAVEGYFRSTFELDDSLEEIRERLNQKTSGPGFCM